MSATGLSSGFYTRVKGKVMSLRVGDVERMDDAQWTALLLLIGPVRVVTHKDGTVYLHDEDWHRIIGMLNWDVRQRVMVAIAERACREMGAKWGALQHGPD